MDISKTIAGLKARADFSDKVGMILVHNGTVRGWSRNDRATVGSLSVKVDVRANRGLAPGIFTISGNL